MVDRPILFSAPMVRALLAGTKTQTRRVIKPRGDNSLFAPGMWADSYVLCPGNAKWRSRDVPFAVGDRLWVKETWWIATRYSYGTTPGGDELPPPQLAYRRGDPVHYAADGDPPNCANRHYGPDGLRGRMFAAPDPYAVWHRKASIHMPRWASRLTLTVIDVRVERLQDISEEDCLFEGAKIAAHANLGRGNSLNGVMVETDQPHVLATPRAWYRELWDSINGPGAWDANPWVAAVSFDVREGNIDA